MAARKKRAPPKKKVIKKKPIKKVAPKKKPTKVIVAKRTPKRCPCKTVQRVNARNARRARVIALRKRMAALKAARMKRIQQAKLR